ncbi:MAG TPA: MFS transporter [Fuerstia sp.]|nr:MFS transporter [Fuerstiella sp.]
MPTSPYKFNVAADPTRVRWEFTTLATMYVCYAAFMLCRNTVVAASPAMVQDPSLGLDIEKFGRLMSWASVGAIVGKLVTGVAADRIGGRRLLLLTLLLTAACTAAFGLVSSIFFFGGLNFAGQFFKAGGWPAMAKIIGKWYSSDKHGRVWSIISTSSRVGTITAGVVLGALLTWLPWRGVFIVSGVVATAMVFVGYVWLKDRPEDVGISPLVNEDSPTAKEPHFLDGTTLFQACLVFVLSARVWLICLGLAFLTALMDFFNFIPLYLSETVGIAPGQAAMAGSAFPTGMFVALIACGIFYDRLSRRRLVWAIGGLLCLSCSSVLFLWSLPSLPLSDSLRLPAAMLSIFVFGFSVSPAYYIPMSVFSIAFGGRHSGFLIALIDVFGYSGAFVFNFFGGSIVKNHGWPVFLGLLLTVAVLAVVTVTLFLHLEYISEKKQNALENAVANSAG